MKKLSVLEKKRLIQVSLWMVNGRWIYIAGLVFIGTLSKIVGGVNVNFPVVLIVAFGINAIVFNLFYLWFFRGGEERSDLSLRLMALFFLFMDLFLLSLVVHYAGTIESTSFLYYIFVIVASSFIYGMRGTFLFALLSGVAFSFLVAGEQFGLFPHLQRYSFSLPFFNNFSATLMITVNVIISFFVTGFFTGFLADLVRKDEKKLILEKEKTESILQSLDDGILVLNGDGEIIHFNGRLKSILKIDSFDKEKFKEQPADIAALLGYVFSADDIKTLGKNDISIFRDFILNLDGEKFIKVISLPLKELEGITGVIKIVRDETKEKMLDKMKTDFITIAAHKLRTPLSATKWVFESLKRGDLAPFSGEQKENIEMGYESNERMIRLVNDFLNAARLVEGDLKYNFRRRNFRDFLEEVTGPFVMRARSKNINFKTEIDISDIDVFFEADQFRAALEGLIENAFIYTKRGGSIVFSAKQSPNGQDIIMMIKDSGIGIPAKQKNMIFNKFYRAANAMHVETEGSGLGLYLAKEIIKRHEGKIWFESEENKGSTFFVELPVNPHLAGDD